MAPERETGAKKKEVENEYTKENLTYQLINQTLKKENQSVNSPKEQKANQPVNQPKEQGKST